MSRRETLTIFFRRKNINKLRDKTQRIDNFYQETTNA